MGEFDRAPNKDDYIQNQIPRFGGGGAAPFVSHSDHFHSTQVLYMTIGALTSSYVEGTTGLGGITIVTAGNYLIFGGADISITGNAGNITLALGINHASSFTITCNLNNLSVGETTVPVFYLVGLQVGDVITGFAKAQFAGAAVNGFYLNALRSP